MTNQMRQSLPYLRRPSVRKTLTTDNRPGSMVVLKHPRPGEPWRGDLEAVRELQSCFHLQLDVQRGKPSPPVIGLALLASRDCGLLETDDGSLRLTPRGRLLSNEVFSRFFG